MSRPAIRLPRLRRGRTRGQSLVEFALILPVFALLFAATLDLGRLFYSQITLTNAAREGAFQGAQTPNSYDDDDSCQADEDPTTDFDDENLVVCRVVLESNKSFVTVTPEDVDFTCTPSGCPKALGTVAKVTVTGDFTFVTPLLAPFFGGQQTIELRASAVAQREYVPTPPPSFGFTSPSPSPTPAPTPPPEPTGSPGPSPSESASASPTPAAECTVPSDGSRGVYPPNVDGLDPDTAEQRIEAKGLDAIRDGSLTSGQKNVVRAQEPDHTVCVPRGSEVRIWYRQ